MVTRVDEGRIPFEGASTWYRSIGDRSTSDQLAILCLHGGPGATWWHMKPYEALAREGWRVIFYDQLGCGQSAVEAEHSAEMFDVDLYVREIDAVRSALCLERILILGHSWGGLLAMAYAVTRPPGLEGLIVQSSGASFPFWLTELDVLRAALPPEVEATLRLHERERSTGSEEYRQAVRVFYDRHLCRVPYPNWLEECFLQAALNTEVYGYMNGPSEFHITGTLRDYDIEDRLSDIDVPTLLFCGRHDEVTPATVRRAHERIADSRFVVLTDSSHMAQAEQPDETLDLVRGFISEIESSRVL